MNHVQMTIWCLAIVAYLIGNALAQEPIRFPTIEALEARIRVLEARLPELEAENAALRAQLRARDAGKQPTLAESKITMQSIPGCRACEHWYATERPKLVAAGWLVDRETVTTWPAGRVFPRWRVCALGKCVEIEHCSNFAFMERLRNFIQ